MQTSVNTMAHLGLAPEALLGKRIVELLTPEDTDRLTSRNLKEGKRRYAGGVTPRNSRNIFDVVVHKHQNLLIFELEPHAMPNKTGNAFDTYESWTDAMSETDGQLGLGKLCEHIAKRIRRITGFDRVMVYRFLEDNSGSVVAEDRRGDLTPFLGLRYPASDIPAQARRLYLLNTLRLKPDVTAERVSIIPAINPYTGAALDMSYCILRAMSPVHDEYLRNMGVSSSLSISIIQDGRLWGLIACHHTQPRLVPHPIRITCEVLARVFSSRIAAAEDEDQRGRSAALSGLIQRLIGQLRNHRDVEGTLKTHGERIQSAMRAQGAAFYLRGTLFLSGATPRGEQVERLLRWLTDKQKEHVLATERLHANFPEAGEFTEHSSGLFSLRIGLDGPDFILWFRPALEKVIQWAGNPEKRMQATPAGERISPRLSFEIWKQTVSDTAEPWDRSDRQFAASMRDVVAEALLLQVNDEVTRLNMELSRSNIELNSFAYAASHDLQEPLRMIRSYTQLIIRGAGKDFAPATREFLAIIEGSANRMVSLITSLLAYSELGGTERRQREPVNSEDALRWALMNLADAVQKSGAQVTYDPLPVILADHQHTGQLLQNLIGNAIKYRRAHVSPHIHVSAVLQDHAWCFSITDNGQGFEPQYADLIFGAFKRLHGQDVPGSGIGLATCKRIVELNGGRIWAQSGGKDCGATFSFTVPCAETRQAGVDNPPAATHSSGQR